VRTLTIVLVVQFVLASVFLTLIATGTIFGGDDNQSDPEPAAVHTVNRFDGDRAWATLQRQVKMGPRPAGSPQSRKLAEQIRKALPRGRFQPVPGGLRNVIGTTPGREPTRTVVVAAHYDTKDIKGFVGANDGAGGVAALIELARGIKPRTLRPTIVWMALDGEESPGPEDGDESEFEKKGIRGAKVAARAYKDAEAMILLDFIADKRLSIPRESNSDLELWAKLRAAAGRVGAGRSFPDDTQGPISDDHIPFLKAGVPSIDLIDFNFPCWHQTCDDLSAVSKTSLDASGETVRELLASL
jgi:glutaminyl-peptide cyclotransferase